MIDRHIYYGHKKQQQVINVMKAWNLQADQMEDIIDKVNVLGKELPKRMVTYGALRCA